ALSTTYVSPDQLTATVPSSLIATGGSGWITVKNPNSIVPLSNLAFLPVANPTTTLNMAQSTYSTGTSSAYSLAQGDFNADGKLDIVVSNYSSGTVAVFLGNGDGTFQPPSTFAAGVSPWGIAVGDLNGDGNLDLVVGQADDGEASFYVLLGNGDGTFQAPQICGSGNYFGNYNPVLVDVNRDGILDVLVPEYGTASVGLYLGNGDGTFQTRQQAASFGQGKNLQLAVGDFNGDGFVDFSVGANGNTFVVLGNGDGTFQSPTSLASPEYCWITVVGDFNNDGKQDYACGSELSSTSGVFLGNGDGTFHPYSNVVLGTSSYAIAAGDINADGNLDIVAGDSGAGVAVALGNGDGTFQSPIAFSSGDYAFQIIAGNYTTSGGLGIATVDGNGNLVILLQTVSLTPSAFDFTSQAQGVASGPQVFTLTNSTSSSVNISAISFTGANPADFAQTNNCGNSVASGASCAIQVMFTPVSPGLRTATLTVTDDAPGSLQISTLTGVGIISALANLSANTVTFANQALGTISTPQTVTLSNSGTGPLVISSIAVTGANASEFSEVDNCGGSVSPSSSCTLTFTFQPAAAGLRAASVTFTDNAASSPQSLALSGTGAQAIVGISTSVLTFPAQAVGTSSSSLPVTISNTGNAALTIASISMGGANAADFGEINTCGASVAPSASCTMNVTFNATAAGLRSAIVIITDNAASGSQSVSLTGTGAQASVGVSTAALTFAAQIVGTSSLLPVTISNNGNVTLTIASISISGVNAADLTQANTCGASVAPSANCTVNVTFNPASGGLRSATLTITDNAGTQTISLTGTGQDFTLETPAAQIVSAGTNASFQVQVSPIGGFRQPISFTCADTLALTACNVAPSTITLDGAPASITVTVVTTGPAVAATSAPASQVPSLPMPLFCAVLAVGILVVSTLHQQNRHHAGRQPLGSAFARAALLLIALLGMGACAGQMQSQQSPKTAAGSHQFILTATSGKLKHTTPLQVTVQ
ncbi:MAG: choice-of-anchor D domain-containing protein, partial [Candidatus Acidiferrum sp.]